LRRMHWTVVLEAGKAQACETARKALATFSEACWRPLRSASQLFGG